MVHNIRLDYYERQILDLGLQTEFKAQRGMWKLEFNHWDFILLLLFKYIEFAKGYLIISMKEIIYFFQS